jgi:hypothetical protein
MVGEACSFTRKLDRINKDSRAAYLKRVIEGGPTEAKEFLGQLDPKTRAKLVNTLSGFCGAIDFKMDPAVY